jgi:hypothetical protein
MERPILFSGEMVRALLDGRKTVTRRIVKPQPPAGCEYTINGAGDHALCFAAGTAASASPVCVPPTGTSADHRLRCPYGQPGDRLWVRETWAAHWMYDDVPPTRARSGLDDDNQFFAAGPSEHGTHGAPPECRGRWRPSIHMPRWASRLSLRVTGVRVERLQDISEDDARAEGVAPFGERYESISLDQRIVGCPGGQVCRVPCGCFRAGDAPYRASFACLWDEINGDRALWSSNPWVWAVSFEVVR